MRVALAAGVLAAFALLPYLLRPSLLAHGSPRVLGWYGATSLLGIAAGTVALLAAMVSPGPLPLADLPRAVEVCVVAAGRLLSHPMQHWPSILAAVLLLAAAARVVVAAVRSTRDARHARPPRGRFPAEERTLHEHLGSVPPDVRLIPFDGPVAFTAGVCRPVIVISAGLMRALAPEERVAVVAHERAHASRRHTAALSAARVIARAFGSVPGVRASVDLLVTALEARADRDAAAAVGDPLVVARALATTARLSLERPAAVAGVADGELRYRVGRLTRGAGSATRRGLTAVLVLTTAATMLAQGVAWSAGQQALTRERLALALHDTCHSPHGPAIARPVEEDREAGAHTYDLL